MFCVRCGGWIPILLLGHLPGSPAFLHACLGALSPSLSACMQLDPEPLSRKRAAHVLRAALGGADAPSFRLFFKLYQTLEDFGGLHLIQVMLLPAMMRCHGCCEKRWR